MYKKLLSLALATVMGMGMGTSTLAAEFVTPIPAEAVVASEIVTHSTRINWNGTAVLGSSWNNITSSNNVFPDSPKVTSNASNPGTVTIRVVDGAGKQIGGSKTVAAGKSVTLDQIPALSGSYTIQGKTSTAGTYTFNID